MDREVEGGEEATADCQVVAAKKLVSGYLHTQTSQKMSVKDTVSGRNLVLNTGSKWMKKAACGLALNERDAEVVTKHWMEWQG